MHFTILLAILLFGNVYTIFRSIKYINLLKSENTLAANKNKLIDVYVAAFFFGTPALAFFMLFSNIFREEEKKINYRSLKVLLVLLIIQAIILGMLFGLNVITY